jgi:glucose-6-phosphate-specific signal transduction histidine kinase
MQIRSLAAKLAICCASFFLFVFSFSINEAFDGFALYMTGISLVFIPAGFKLLCLLVGGEAAVVGLLLSSVYVSTRIWDHTAFTQMVYFAFASVGSYYVAVLLVKKFMHIDNTLSNLRYLHIIILSAAASILNGTVHNLVYVWQGKVKLEDFFAHAAAMVVGDFLGCFIVIMFFNACIDMAYRVMDSKRRTVQADSTTVR